MPKTSTKADKRAGRKQGREEEHPAKAPPTSPEDQEDTGDTEGLVHLVPIEHPVNAYLVPETTITVPTLMMQMWEFFMRPIENIRKRMEEMEEETRRNGIVERDIYEMDPDSRWRDARASSPASRIGNMNEITLPTWEGFMRSVGVTKREMDELVRLDPRVARLAEHCDSTIKDLLINRGLNRAYEPTFAKFVAVNLTDMKDKRVQDNRNLDVNELLESLDGGEEEDGTAGEDRDDRRTVIEGTVIHDVRSDTPAGTPREASPTKDRMKSSQREAKKNQTPRRKKDMSKGSGEKVERKKKALLGLESMD